MDKLTRSKLSTLKKNELLELCIQLQDKYLEASKEVEKKEAEASPDALPNRAFGLAKDSNGNFILSTISYDVEKEVARYLCSESYDSRFELAHQELDARTTDHALFGSK